MFRSWRDSFCRWLQPSGVPSPVVRRFAQPRLEALEDRWVPSASSNTVASTQDFNPANVATLAQLTATSIPVEVSFQLDSAGNAWEYNPSLGTGGTNPNLVQISSAATGQWSSIAATFGADGNPVLFAINKADGSLWEHSLAFGDAPEATMDANWRKLSSGVFLEISATADRNNAGDGINPVVFAITADRTLWEHNASFSSNTVAEGTLNANWARLSTGSFAHIAAAEAHLPTLASNTGATGVPNNPLTLLTFNPIVFAITTGGNLWEHNGNTSAGQGGPLVEETTDAYWSRISSGSFLDVAAVLVPTVTGTGPGVGTGTLAVSRPVAYAIVAGSGNLYEHNVAFSGGSLPEGTTDGNWAPFTGSFFEISATIDIESAATTGSNLFVNPVVFGTLQGSFNLYEHNARLRNAGAESATDANWVLLSSGSVLEFDATFSSGKTSGPTPSITGDGDPAVFGVLSTFDLWEHLFVPGSLFPESATDRNWFQRSTGILFAIEPGPSLSVGLPGT